MTLTACRSRVLRSLLALALSAMAMLAQAAPDATTLLARYAELSPRLASNAFKRPLVLDSMESGSLLKGDIYALVEHPFAEVNAALNGPSHWCEVLILHLNTKYCRAANTASGTVLNVSVGKKFDQPLEDAYRLDFTYHPGLSAPDYFAARLDADKGPLGTHDYRILLEAVALPENRTFLHLTYSYAFGFAGKIAMQGYLATAGSAKVGFTRQGRQANGQADYIGGMRGVVERNTMRYYLAIDAYLDALAAPAAAQVAQRLQGWFDATEAYPRQLHEMERADYLSMKYSEIQRQRSSQ